MASLDAQVLEIISKTKVTENPEKVADFFARYLTSGNTKGSATGAGVKYEAARDWMKTKWADEVMDLMRDNMQIGLQQRFSGLINKVLSEIEDRLDKGDELYPEKYKDGKKVTDSVRAKVKAANLITILATMYDKRALLRGEPTSRTEKTTTDKRLEKLSKRFAALPKASMSDDEGDSSPASEDGAIH